MLTNLFRMGLLTVVAQAHFELQAAKAHEAEDDGLARVAPDKLRELEESTGAGGPMFL